MQLKSALQYNILVRASHVVADSRLMDTSSFLVKLLTMFYLRIANTCPDFQQSFLCMYCTAIG